MHTQVREEVVDRREPRGIWRYYYRVVSDALTGEESWYLLSQHQVS